MAGCDNHQRLQDQLLHIPALRVKVSVVCGNAVAPLANEDASVFIVHQWNMSKLDSTNQVWAGSDGTFVLPANAFPMHTEIEQGPNVRIGICMNGAQANDVSGAEGGAPDLLNTQCVIYGNLSVSIADLVLSSGAPMTRPVTLHAASSDETGYIFRLNIMPEDIDARLHYSSANIGFLKGIAAQHLPMTTVSAALMSCSQVRKTALVTQMKTRGVPEEHAAKFYMQLPMGSIFDVHVDNPEATAVVDIPQWHALNERSAILLAESHAPKLTEAAMKWISWECADHGVDPTNSMAVSAHINELAASVDGRARLASSFKNSVMRANEDGFRYTSDSEIRGFRVLNTMHGVKLEARFSSTGEKQNGHGLDSLTCDNHMQRACTLYTERMQATHASDLRELDWMCQELQPAEYSAAVDKVNAQFARRMSDANIAASMHGFMADCEDACASQVAVMQAPANIHPDRLSVIVREVLESGVYPACAVAMTGPVTQLLQAIRVHSLMSTVERGLCFAHGANLAEMKLAAATPPVEGGIDVQFDATVKDINSGILGGHACAFSVLKNASSEPLGPHHTARHMSFVTAHEGTNPIERVPSEKVIYFDSHTTSPELEAKFAVINGNMPVTTAKSIISELSSHSANNIINCKANAVTYTSTHSPFYHTLITSNGAYVYSEQNGVMRPTARIASLGDPAIKVFLIEGKLLDSVTIGDKTFSENHLLDMVVRASTCLAPTYQRILERQRTAGLRMATLRDGMPPVQHKSMTRVICRTPVLQVSGIKTDACHQNEQHARVSAVQAIHAGALVGSCNSHTFNLFLPSV